MALLEQTEGTDSSYMTFEERKQREEIEYIYREIDNIKDETALEYLVELQIERDQLLKRVNNKLGEIAIGLFSAMIGFFLGYAIFAI